MNLPTLFTVSNNDTALTIKCQCCPNIETSQLICTSNQFTGFYMWATLACNGLTL